MKRFLGLIRKGSVHVELFEVPLKRAGWWELLFYKNALFAVTGHAGQKVVTLTPLAGIILDPSLGHWRMQRISGDEQAMAERISGEEIVQLILVDYVPIEG